MRNNTLASSSVLGNRYLSGTKKPVRVAVTGAAGAIGYALLFRIARYF